MTPGAGRGPRAGPGLTEAGYKRRALVASSARRPTPRVSGFGFGRVGWRRGADFSAIVSGIEIMAIATETQIQTVADLLEQLGDIPPRAS